MTSNHSAVHEILPWYVNGTVSAEERAIVARHVESCAECRSELTFLQELGTEVPEAPTVAPSLDDSLRRTLAAVEQWERTRPAPGRSRLVEWLAGLWSAPRRMTSLVLVGQFAVIVLLAGGLILRRAESDYTTLSGAGGAAGGPRLTLMFQPGATEEAVRRTLLEINGVIVSGPSALGVYILELPGRTDGDPAVEDVITTLRARSMVIRFVERQP